MDPAGEWLTEDARGSGLTGALVAAFVLVFLGLVCTVMRWGL